MILLPVFKALAVGVSYTDRCNVVTLPNYSAVF